MKKIGGIYRSGMIRLKKNSSYKGTYKKTSTVTEEIVPVAETNASSDRETNNQSLNMRLYYESLREQKEEYKHFYRDEQELEHDLKNIRLDDDKLLDKLKHLIHSYNHTILSLAKFDKSFNTGFSEEIISFIQPYGDKLFSVGIKLLVDGELFIYPGILEDVVKTRPSKLYFLIGHSNSLFYKLYQRLQQVKIPQSDQEIPEVDDYVGTIIDAKC